MSHSTHRGFRCPPTVDGSALPTAPTSIVPWLPPRPDGASGRTGFATWDAAGVGQSATFAASVMPPDFRLALAFQLLARGVGQAAGDDEDPLPSVGSADGESRNSKRPRGVAETFQISEAVVEPQ